MVWRILILTINIYIYTYIYTYVYMYIHITHYMEVSTNQGPLFGSPHKRDQNMLGPALFAVLLDLLQFVIGLRALSLRHGVWGTLFFREPSHFFGLRTPFLGLRIDGSRDT